MQRHIVKDYSVIASLTKTDLKPRGASASPKELIFHILQDNSEKIDVLDIGFGDGSFGRLIKSNPSTAHWSIDGVDGFEANCSNLELFDERFYRNIWYGLAQDIPSEHFKKYKIICLLDVIEHLTAEMAKWLLHTLLRNMGEDAFLMISTPLWFYPQDQGQSGDLEEHLIGIPATSMMSLMPKMYSINHPLIGAFVLGKQSLDFIEFFQPTANKSFSYERGIALANVINCQYKPGVVFKLG